MSDLILPDSRFEMPELFYPNRKPSGNVKIDWNNPLTTGLVGFWMLDISNRDLTGNNHGTDIGNIERGYKLNGGYKRVVNNNTSDRVNLGSIDSNNPLSCHKNNEVTILVKAALNFTPGSNGNNNLEYSRIIDKSNSGSSANGFGLAIGAETGSDGSPYNGCDFMIDGVSSQLDSAGFIGNDVVQTVSVSHKPGDSRLHIDGILSVVKTDQVTTIPQTTTNAALLNWNHSVNRQYKRPVFLVAVWDIQVKDFQLKKLHAAPYQFLTPA